jgi:hypothetical protein
MASDSSAVILKGLWTTGNRNVYKFESSLQQAGVELIPFTYPFQFFLPTWLEPQRDRKRARKLKAKIGDRRPHLIAHSNGCRIAALAMEEGARFDLVIFFAPAWSAKRPFPEDAFNHLYVIHSYYDFTVALGAIVPNHEFGWLGVKGYEGPENPRITSIDASPCFHKSFFRRAKQFAFWDRFVTDACTGKQPRDLIPS